MILVFLFFLFLLIKSIVSSLIRTSIELYTKTSEKYLNIRLVRKTDGWDSYLICNPRDRLWKSNCMNKYAHFFLSYCAILMAWRPNPKSNIVDDQNEMCTLIELIICEDVEPFRLFAFSLICSVFAESKRRKHFAKSIDEGRNEQKKKKPF